MKEKRAGLAAAEIVLIIIGVLCILYCGIVVMIIGTGSWFNFFFGIVGTLAIIFALLLKYIMRLPKWAYALIFACIALCAANFAFFEARIISFGNQSPKNDADYVIVLGAKTNPQGPSYEYARRLDAAAKYAKQNPASMIIVTGGQGADEHISEGAAGRDYLIEKGIESSRIICETLSTSTQENLIFAKDAAMARLKDELELSSSVYDSDDLKKQFDEIWAKSSFVIVSSSFHLYRASKHAFVLGYSDVDFLGASGKKILMPHYYVREYGAYLLERVNRHF